jgi:hypothetical protein
MTGPSSAKQGEHFIHPKNPAKPASRMMCCVPAPLIAVLVLATLAFAVTPAFAEKIYYPGISFGEPGSGPGQFKEPAGVAVNDASPLLEPVAGGDVYVVDKGNDRVERFSASGEYKGQFNGSGEYEVKGKKEVGPAAPTGKLSSPEAIAVNDDESSPSFGDVYVADTGNKVVDKFSATGEYESQITEAEICLHESCVLEGLAVDSSGHLFVERGVDYEPEPGKLQIAIFWDEFNESGGFEKARQGTDRRPTGSYGIAVESNDDVYVIEWEEVAERLSAEPAAHQGEEDEGQGPQGTTALAVVPSASTVFTGDVLLDSGGQIALYTPLVGREGRPQKPLETFPGKSVPKGYEGLSGSDGVAVNASATVYASESGAGRVESFNYVSVPVVVTEPPSGVTESELTLHGSVNPEGEEVKECFFEYGTEAGKYTNTAECVPSAGGGAGDIGKGSAPVLVSAKVLGLKPAEVRSFRLVALSAGDVQANGKGLTVARPATAGEAVSEVGSSSATVSAQIDAGGLATCYWVEYGTSTSYGSETAKSCVGSGEDEKARVDLVELQPNTVYHFRVQVGNGLGAKPGGDVLFTTFPASSAGLPDGRVYEAVSSVGTGDETNVYVPEGMSWRLGEGRHGVETNRPFEAAAGGDSVAYVGDAPNVGGNGQVGDFSGNQYVAERASGGGWAQVDVDPSGYRNGYVALSGDLSVGVVAATEQLAEDAPVEAGTGKAYGDLYGRSLGWRAAAAGSLEPVLGPFAPLITATPPCPVTEFGGVFQNELHYEPLFGGGNAGTAAVPAFSHVVVEADAALPSTPATGTPGSCGAGGGLEDDLYDSVGGRLYLVNVLPGGKGEVQAGATIGRQGRSIEGSPSLDASNAVSANGSRIYWSAVEPGEVGAEERPKALYVRENDTQPQSPVEDGECTIPTDACTVEVDLHEPGAKGLGDGGGQFWTASSDGSRVFFTDENRLTKESTAEGGKPDLYEYDLEAPEGERLEDLSLPVKPEPGVHADVQGVVGSSEDGSYVYFAADGVLSEGANAEGGAPAPDQPNLYVRHDGVTRFIATLSQEDGEVTPGATAVYGDWQAAPGHRTAEVAADGQSVVFMSRRPLTDYDNALDGVSMTEVFVYDAATERLTCASCNPSGEPPVAPALPEFGERISEIWGSFLPPSNSLASYQPRVISENGDRVFFDSIEPLVPQDENGFLGVYEWERDGTGSCEQASGCIFLLSGGQSNDNSYLIDASSSGDDVFFVSRAQLVKADHGDDDVLYDARVGGVEPPSEKKCAGAGCQGVPPAPPLFATPASATITGVDDLEPPPSSPPAPEVKKVTKKAVKCRKPKELSRGKCLRKPKPRKGSRAKRSSRDRRSDS